MKCACLEDTVASRRARVGVRTAALAGMMACVWPFPEGHAQAAPANAAAAATATTTQLVGVWTLNRDLSDSPTDGVPPGSGGGSRGEAGGRRRGGGGFGGGGGRGGGGPVPGAP